MAQKFKECTLKTCLRVPQNLCMVEKKTRILNSNVNKQKTVIGNT